MSTSVEERAIEIVAEAVGNSREQSAMAAALCRLAGSTYAKLNDGEAAAALHRRCAINLDLRSATSKQALGRRRR